MNESEMMAAHDGRDDGVYLVFAFGPEGKEKHGVFSTSIKAAEWMASLPEYNCCCAPFIVDEPDYGNVKKEEMN